MADRPADSPRLLATAMARTTGLDLSAGQRLGHVSADAVSDMIATCARCSAWQECPSWMEGQAAPVGQAPGYCLNRGRFEDLRSAIAEEATS